MRGAFDQPDIAALEQALLDENIRADRTALNRLLAEDFVEFGSSGRIYARGEIIDALAASPKLSERLAMSEVSVRRLAANVALIAYVAIGEETGRRVNRSSVWILDGETWRMAFHQGTVAAMGAARG